MEVPIDIARLIKTEEWVAQAMAIFGKEGEVDLSALARAASALAPMLALALTMHDRRWLLVMIATISAYIGRESSGLAPVGVLLHGMVIVVGFIILIASLAVPFAFVVCVATLATLSILLIAEGEKLRMLGNFTFIPALYMTYGMSANTAPADLIAHSIDFLPFIIVAVLPVFFLAAIEHMKLKPSGESFNKHFGKVFSKKELGSPVLDGETMVTIAVAIGITAAVAGWLKLPYGQWVIWSAASVVTGNVYTGNKKLQNRIIGAFIGVPSGIGISFFIPYNIFTISLITLIAMLTLVSFRRYVVGFSIRCACAAVGVVLLTHSDPQAAFRAVDIFIGGVIGVLTAWAVHWCKPRLRSVDNKKQDG